MTTQSPTRRALSHPSGSIRRLLFRTPRLVLAAYFAEECISAVAERIAGTGASAPQVITEILSMLVCVLALWAPARAALLTVVPLGLALAFTTHGTETFLLLVTPIATMATQRWRRVAATAAGLVAFAGLRCALWPQAIDRTQRFVAYVGLLGVMFLLGFLLRLLLRAQDRGHSRVATLQQQNQHIQEAERSQLAAELRHVVLHKLSEMQRQLDELHDVDDPATIRHGLRVINGYCVGALAELRALVGMLRTELVDLDAIKSLRATSAVAERAAADLEKAGFPVTATVDAAVDGLNPSVQQACNRVLQEAVGNILNHASAGTPTEIALTCDAHEVEIRVRNTLAAGSDARGEARGLVRMRERLRSLGGRLTIADDHGEWLLIAAVPVCPGSSASASSAGAATIGDTLEAVLLPPAGRRARLRTIATVLAGALGLYAAKALLDSPTGGEWLTLVCALALLGLLWQRWLGYGLAAVAFASHGALIGQVRGNLVMGELIAHHTLSLVILGTALAALAVTQTRRRELWFLATLLLIHVGVAVATRPEQWALALSRSLPFLVVGWLAALVARSFYRTWHSQRQRIADLTARQAELRAQERALLSRELHDVVAHQFTVITLQIMGHGDSDDLGELRQALALVQQATQTTRLELSLLVEVMGDDPATSGEGLMRPTAVAESLRGELLRHGHQARGEVDPAADALNADMQRTIARALQEATTNILRYAPPKSGCEYSVKVGPYGVRLRVSSPLPMKRRTSALSTGAGLAGLRERVALQSGEFRAAPEDGSWVVSIRLPIPA